MRISSWRVLIAGSLLGALVSMFVLRSNRGMDMNLWKRIRQSSAAGTGRALRGVVRNVAGMNR